MFKINDVAIDHFKVPLPIVLSDSTHGEMTHFGLVTVRVSDEQGQEGLGYTYTPTVSYTHLTLPTKA